MYARIQKVLHLLFEGAYALSSLEREAQGNHCTLHCAQEEFRVSKSERI
jgi:hypothetical protein